MISEKHRGLSCRSCRYLFFQFYCSSRNCHNTMTGIFIMQHLCLYHNWISHSLSPVNSIEIYWHERKSLAIAKALVIIVGIGICNI